MCNITGTVARSPSAVADVAPSAKHFSPSTILIICFNVQNSASRRAMFGFVQYHCQTRMLRSFWNRQKVAISRARRTLSHSPEAKTHREREKKRPKTHRIWWARDARKMWRTTILDCKQFILSAVNSVCLRKHQTIAQKPIYTYSTIYTV